MALQYYTKMFEINLRSHTTHLLCINLEHTCMTAKPIALFRAVLNLTNVQCAIYQQLGGVMKTFVKYQILFPFIYLFFFYQFI